ncbi:hypothetical protein K470DRAFT_254907 [Piedraia hortae CBS 480.64]|uniref:Exosome complex component CSL4 C-terminal domain-containing protein n=1 Tax=Piedraia hortae CBS 480.64 TaxID=1314780 RepID=A0A6A7C8Q5_9PEZI|nr:hypothetical protein K470DRAFT_254907 [Piedraia hortae CBS 480.64]
MASSRGATSTIGKNKNISSSNALLGFARALLPTPGSYILGIVTRTRSRQAQIMITALGYSGETTVSSPFSALIRQQDIRATEKDKVVVANCFHVGDVVRAKVISLGDERNYYCSTEGDECGVVVGHGDEGETLVPISWCEMRNEATGEKFPRKVAKPF